MAVIQVLFKAGGEESEVLRVSYKLTQDKDPTGQPAGEVRGGIINVTLLTAKATEARFGWAANRKLKQDGEIEYIDHNGDTVKTLVFTDGFCIGYQNEFDAFSMGSGPDDVTYGAMDTMTLSCRILEVGGEIHENTWPDVG